MLACLMVFVVPCVADAIVVSLPTSNDNLFKNRPEAFYQRTARNDDSAWQGGMYGLVRNVRTLRSGETFTRFHEGIDVRPMFRDRHREPLDSVRAIAEGIVVYVNDVPGHSNYGRYVVIEHQWDGSPFYSLYAHLNRTWVDSGARVARGEPLGRLGYTGVGINRARAHLHLEICMLYNSNFQLWYQEEHDPSDSNYHSVFNGKNLAGINPADFLLYMRAHPEASMQEFFATREELYTLQFSRNPSGHLNLTDRYAWLLSRRPRSTDRSWKVTFTSGGVPVRVEPVAPETAAPIVCDVADVEAPIRYASKRILRRQGGMCILSDAGNRLVALLNTEEEVRGRE